MKLTHMICLYKVFLKATKCFKAEQVPIILGIKNPKISLQVLKSLGSIKRIIIV